MSRLIIVFWGMLIIARIGATGFTCPGVGDFPDPNDCKVIHKCKSRGVEANDFLCPPGTIFDQKCVWPHATRRRCDSDESEGASKTGFVCDSAGEFPDPENCRFAHICLSAGDPPVRMHCPPGLVYDGPCVPPDQSSRQCDSPSKGEEAGSSRSLFKVEKSRPDPNSPMGGDQVEIATSSIKDLGSTDESSSNSVENLSNDNGVHEKASLAESGLSADESELGDSKDTSERPTLTKLPDKKFYAGSRGFSITNHLSTSENDTTSEPPESVVASASKGIFHGLIKPGGSGMEVGADRVVTDAAKELPAPEAKENYANQLAADNDIKGGSKGLDTVPSRDDSPAELRKCLETLFAAISVLFERLKNRIKMARLDGSKLIVDASKNVENHANIIRDTLTGGLEARRAQINEAIEQGKAHVTKAVNLGGATVSKTVTASGTLSRAALETSLGLTANALNAGRYLTQDLLSVGLEANRGIYNAGRELASDLSIPNPITWIQTTRNRILHAVASLLRSMADFLEH